MKSPRQFVNTRELRRPALKFMSEGFYCESPKGTKGYYDYWNIQRDRCLNGYSVGGVRITGQHYFYLNFSPILALTETSGKSGVKEEIMPRFWDGDYNYFHALEIAKNGITEEELEKLDLGVDPVNLEGGNHMVVLKARGKGYSYKAGSMLARNFCLGSKSKNYAMAYEKEYLIRDGLLSKVWDTISHIDAHTPYRQPRLIDRQMHKKAGYKKVKGGTEVEMGRKNEVMGVTLKDNPDKARGKRGDLIFFEEAGKFPGLKQAWEICRSNVEQGKYTVGTMIAYGTGGTEDADYEALEELFYNPESYNVQPFENIWDEGANDTKCAFFVPSYINWEGFIDEHGNSDIEGAKADIEAERDQKREADDPNALEQFTSENPFTPQEATLRTSTNVLPTFELKEQLNSVQSDRRYRSYSIGRLYYDKKGKVKFKLDPDRKPIFRYPTPKGTDRRGAVAIKESPIRQEDGSVPDNMYMICHDPYAHDGSPEGSSLGATYVIKRTNRISHTLNQCIVASYVGRPSTTDAYNRTLFMLAEYYNCKIGFENNRGNVIPYAKRFKKLHRLEEQFEILDKKQRSRRSRTTSRPYGIAMTKQRVNDAQLYLRDWLLTPVARYFDEESHEQSEKLVLNTILDPALLQELIKYDPRNKTKFDRVSALMVGMYYLQDMDARKQPSKSGVKKHADFFNRSWFQ